MNYKHLLCSSLVLSLLLSFSFVNASVKRSNDIVLEKSTETPIPLVTQSHAVKREIQTISPLLQAGMPGESESNAATNCTQIINAITNATNGDTIYIGAGTIELTEPIKIHDKNLTLIGSGEGNTVLTVPNSGGYRHFAIDGTSDVIMQDFTLQGPWDGSASAGTNNGGVNDKPNGGIYKTDDAGTLTLTRMTITNCVNNTLKNGNDNYGGALFFKDGNRAMKMTDCTISNNKANGDGGGVGIAIQDVELKNCSILGNTSQKYGGGIGGSANLTLNNCLVAGNTANSIGGVYSQYVATLINCTVFENTTTGSIGTINASILAETLTLTNCTVTKNSDGVFAALPPTIKGCIIAGNTSGNVRVEGSDYWLDQGLTTDGNYNIIGYKDNVTEFSVFGKDPTLENHGGKSETILLTPESPAIDAIPTSEYENWVVAQENRVDQRGKPRPNGTNIDIGAIEVSQVTDFSIIVKSPTMYSGETQQLTIKDIHPNEYDDTPVLWQTSDAYIDADGNLTAISPGIITITAKLWNTERTLQVEVLPKVIPPTPFITTQPQGGVVVPNEEFTLSLTADISNGNTLSYQWYKNTTNNNTNGTIIDGATNAQYQPSTTQTGTTYYYCVVTNIDKLGNTETTSHPAMVIVKENTNEHPTISILPPKAIVGTEYHLTFTLEDSATSNWTLSNGSLPDGLKLSQEGVIAGTPTKEGTFTFTISTSSDTASTVQKQFSIIVTAKESDTEKNTENNLYPNSNDSINTDDTGGKVPPTGDKYNLSFWTLSLCMTAGILIFTTTFRKKVEK